MPFIITAVLIVTFAVVLRLFLRRKRLDSKQVVSIPRAIPVAAISLVVGIMDMLGLVDGIAPTGIAAFCATALAAGLASVASPMLGTYLSGTKGCWRTLCSVIMLAAASVFAWCALEVPSNPEVFTHEMHEWCVVIGVATIYVFMLGGYLMASRRAIVPVILAIAFTVLGIAEYFVIMFKEMPIMPSDFLALGTAAEVSGSYSYVLMPTAIQGIQYGMASIAACMLVGSISKTVKRQWQTTFLSVVLGLSLLVAYGVHIVKISYYDNLTIQVRAWEPLPNYYSQGFIPSFVSSAQRIVPSKPVGYSAEYADELIEQLAAEYDEQHGIRRDGDNGGDGSSLKLGDAIDNVNGSVENASASSTRGSTEIGDTKILSDAIKDGMSAAVNATTSLADSLADQVTGDDDKPTSAESFYHIDSDGTATTGESASYDDDDDADSDTKDEVASDSDNADDKQSKSPVSFENPLTMDDEPLTLYDVIRMETVGTPEYDKAHGISHESGIPSLATIFGKRNGTHIQSYAKIPTIVESGDAETGAKFWDKVADAVEKASGAAQDAADTDDAASDAAEKPQDAAEGDETSDANKDSGDAHDAAEAVSDGDSDDNDAAGNADENNGEKGDDEGGTGNASGETIRPTIVTIMNETFSDLSMYRNIGDGYMGPAFFNSLQQKGAVKGGTLDVSAFGGGTCNTEFEYLTGNSMGYVATGIYPYTVYDMTHVESLAHQFKDDGYDTVAIHPNLATNWNRANVYPQLGFDEFYDIDDFADAETLRNHVTDEATYDKIIELVNQSDDPQFILDVTMQNHGGYTTHMLPHDIMTDYSIPSVDTSTLNEYLTCIKVSDEALEKLIGQLKVMDKPVALVFFGDHQPNMGGSINDYMFPNEDEQVHTAREYRTEYVIWTNYDTETGKLYRDMTFREQDEFDKRQTVNDATSSNYLGATMMETLGFDMTDVQKAMLTLKQDMPQINCVGHTDASGLEYQNGKVSADIDDAYDKLGVIQYREMFDNGGKIYTQIIQNAANDTDGDLGTILGGFVQPTSDTKDFAGGVATTTQ